MCCLALSLRHLTRLSRAGRRAASNAAQNNSRPHGAVRMRSARHKLCRLVPPQTRQLPSPPRQRPWFRRGRCSCPSCHRRSRSACSAAGARSKQLLGLGGLAVSGYRQATVQLLCGGFNTDLDRVHVGELAGRALQAEHDLLGGLSLRTGTSVGMSSIRSSNGIRSHGQ